MVGAICGVVGVVGGGGSVLSSIVGFVGRIGGVVVVWVPFRHERCGHCRWLMHCVGFLAFSTGV